MFAYVKKKLNVNLRAYISNFIRYPVYTIYAPKIV